MFRLFANTNTFVETTENFANTMGLMLSLKTLFNNDETSDQALITMSVFCLMLSMFKFYFVNKQNTYFASQYEKQNRLMDEATETPVSTGIIPDDVESPHEEHDHQCDLGHSDGSSHEHSHGNSHGHSHDAHHDELSRCQSFMVNINFINHVVNYSSAAISLSGVILDDLLQMQTPTSAKLTIVGVGTAIGIGGALARKRNDSKTLMNDMTNLSACGHAHDKEGDNTSRFNAGVEVLGSMSSNFILCTSSYTLINTSLNNITLGFIIPCALVSTVLALFSFFTHDKLNLFYKGYMQENNASSKDNKHDCWTYFKLLADTFNHACDYTAMMIYVAAFTANKADLNFSLPTRCTFLAVAGMFSFAGSVSPFLNESKAMAATATKRNGPC